MKPLFTVFIFTIFLELKQTRGFQEIGGVVIDYDENQNELGNTFRKAYGDHMLEISQLGSEKIASMIPHLVAIVNATRENPLGAVFNYLKELCAEHAKLKLLNKVTNNVRDFAAESGYRGKSEKSRAKSDSRRAFSATSVDKNVEETKAEFDNIDPNLKKENALANQEEKLKKAENKRAEAVAKVEADLKKAESEYERAKLQVQEECEKAYAAAEDICKNAIKKSETDIEDAEKEYEETKKKVEKKLQQANEDYENVTKAVEEDYRAAIEMAKENLDDAEEDYDAALKKGKKQHEDAKRRAAARRQISADQYEAALNGKLTEKIRNTIEKSMNKAEVAYQQALNRANSEWNKAEADAVKEWTNAQKDYEEAKRMAENEANMAFIEAEKAKQKATEELEATVGNAQTELYKKQQLADVKMRIACQDERYDAIARADTTQDEVMKKLKKQWVETRNLAEQNFDRIGHEYREDIEIITQEYHDACSRADALEEELEKITTSKSTRNADNNYGLAKKKRQQKKSLDKSKRGN